jgi:hypothetical protein
VEGRLESVMVELSVALENDETDVIGCCETKTELRATLARVELVLKPGEWLEILADEAENDESWSELAEDAFHGRQPFSGLLLESPFPHHPQ